MADNGQNDLIRRVEELEAALTSLREEFRQLRIQLLENSNPEADPRAEERSYASAERTFRVVEKPKVRREPTTGYSVAEELKSRIAWKSEDWLNKIGIGLLLVGVLYLFKYSVDQGWIVPPLRAAFGFVLGVIMLVTGMRIRRGRLQLGRVLLGGSIAVFYATGFAAYQLYGLISYPIAFAFMTTVTLLALVLSVTQSEALLSVVGIIGGLGTPFFLYSGSGNLMGLIGYTSLVLLGACMIYMHRAWQSLLIATVIGGWAVLITAVSNLNIEHGFMVRAVVQSGLILGAFVFWLIPLYREFLNLKEPERWPKAPPPFTWFKSFLNYPVRAYAVTTPLILVATTSVTWSIEDEASGLVALGICLLCAGIALILPKELNPLIKAHRFAAAVLFTVASILFFESSEYVLQAVVAIQAVLFFYAGRHFEDNGLKGWSIFLVVICSLILTVALMEDGADTPYLINGRALSNLIVVGALGGIAYLMRESAWRSLFFLYAHLLLLGWFYQEISPLPTGQAIVTAVWSLYAVGLLIAGIRLENDNVRRTAQFTLILVVGKLFLVDLERIEPFWRILLFMGLGGLFLLISYYMPGLWHSENDDDSPDAGHDDNKGEQDNA